MPKAATTSKKKTTASTDNPSEESTSSRPRRQCSKGVGKAQARTEAENSDDSGEDEIIDKAPKSVTNRKSSDSKEAKENGENESQASTSRPRRQASKPVPQAQLEPEDSESESETVVSIVPVKKRASKSKINNQDQDEVPAKVPKINARMKNGNKPDDKGKTKGKGKTSDPQPSTSNQSQKSSKSKETGSSSDKKGSDNNNVGEKSKLIMPQSTQRRPLGPVNVNILATLYNYSPRVSTYELERRSRSAVVEQISQFRVFKSVTPFDRRVTALAWHPKEPTLCAVGSKGGDLLLWNYVKDEFQSLLTGIGPGGSVQCLKFDTDNANRIYTCSIDGTFAAKDFGGKKDNVFLNTDNWDKWYTSFDVSNAGGTLMVGDNNGNVTLMTKEGEEVWKARLHKNKVTNIQFSPREPWLVITTSVDNTVKVWDIRMLSNSGSSDVKSPKGGDDRKNRWLQSLDHDKPVNSAYFSPLDGTRLLTTDQHSQLRVYRAPYWTLEKTISHPHRQFQHLTPIRGTWHPLVDIAVAGRYPDEKSPDFVPGELRSIDMIDADTGSTLYQLHEPGLNKISSLNQFSGSGDALLSGMGQTILIWKQKPEESEVTAYQEKISNLKNLMVEEWPGYKPRSKPSAKSKKLKKLEDD